MRRLIVSADDLGWSEAVTEGIIRAHREGIVTSATVIANAPGAGEALERTRREAPTLALGLHLNLTEGRPLAPARELALLVDQEGGFRRSLLRLFTRAQLSAEVRSAIRREVEAQMLWARQHGLEPSHLDSHKHVHVCPALLPTVIELARSHGIRAIRTTAELHVAGVGRLLPSRWSARERLRQWAYAAAVRRWGVAARRAVREAGFLTTDWFFGVRTTGGMSADLLEHLLHVAPQGLGEIMVHPGLKDEATGWPTRLGEARPAELAALCDPRVRRAVEREGWALVSYRELLDDE
jgi:hopanoid biosynthesis associated protein HpnK